MLNHKKLHKAKNNYKQQLSKMNTSWTDAWSHVAFYGKQLVKDVVYLFIMLITFKYFTSTIPPKIISSVFYKIHDSTRSVITTGRGYMLTIFIIIICAILEAFVIRFCMRHILATTFHYYHYVYQKHISDLEKQKEIKYADKYEEKRAKQLGNIRKQHQQKKSKRKLKHMTKAKK